MPFRYLIYPGIGPPSRARLDRAAGAVFCAGFDALAGSDARAAVRGLARPVAGAERGLVPLGGVG